MRPPTGTDLAYVAARLGGASHSEAAALARETAETPLDLYRALVQHVPPALALADASSDLRVDAPAWPALVAQALEDGANLLTAYTLGTPALREALRAHAQDQLLGHGALTMGAPEAAPITLALVADILKGPGSTMALRVAVRQALKIRRAS